MNTLTLRTRFVNAAAASSSSRKSSWSRRSVRAVTPRFDRPVFISSPAPKKSHARLQRAA